MAIKVRPSLHRQPRGRIVARRHGRDRREDAAEVQHDQHAGGDAPSRPRQQHHKRAEQRQGDEHAEEDASGVPAFVHAEEGEQSHEGGRRPAGRPIRRGPPTPSWPSASGGRRRWRRGAGQSQKQQTRRHRGRLREQQTDHGTCQSGQQERPGPAEGPQGDGQRRGSGYRMRTIAKTPLLMRSRPLG